MKPSAILRSLSFRIPARLSASPAVTPLPIKTPFDQRVSAELDTVLLLSPKLSDHASTPWLCHALDASIKIQNIALESLISILCQDSDRKAIGEYLDDNVRMLDACHQLSDQIEIIQEYVESLRVVAHMLEGKFEPNPFTLCRATHVLDACHEVIQTKYYKYGSSLSKLLSMGLLVHGASNLGELSEVLHGSNAVAFLTCGIIGMALSLKSKIKLAPFQAQPMTCCNWWWCLKELQNQVNTKAACSSMLLELQETMVLARNLRERIKCRKEMNNFGEAVEELKRSCRKLEDGVRALEERVKELYKHLISVRMAVMGISN